MARYLAMNVGISFAAFEADLLPRWIDNREPHKFAGLVPTDVASTVLLYVLKNGAVGDDKVVYVGYLADVTFENNEPKLLFNYFDRFAPVEAGPAGDENPLLAERVSRGSSFHYLSKEAFDRVMREGGRRIVRLPAAVRHAIPGYAAEHGMKDDEVIEEALLEYFERREWQV